MVSLWLLLMLRTSVLLLEKCSSTFTVVTPEVTGFT